MGGLRAACPGSNEVGVISSQVRLLRNKLCHPCFHRSGVTRHRQRRRQTGWRSHQDSGEAVIVPLRIAVGPWQRQIRSISGDVSLGLVRITSLTTGRPSSCVELAVSMKSPTRIG